MATILIADDDEKLLKMLRRTLVYEGFEVVTAADGHETLAQLDAHQPDVIVLDWLMPGLDGIQVTERLRAAGDDTMILMLTTITWSSPSLQQSYWREFTPCYGGLAPWTRTRRWCTPI
jgi:DNA-binding response OmpR family regulator